MNKRKSKLGTGSVIYIAKLYYGSVRDLLEDPTVALVCTRVAHGKAYFRHVDSHPFLTGVIEESCSMGWVRLGSLEEQTEEERLRQAAYPDPRKASL